MINAIAQILKITKEEDLLTEFEAFETSLHTQLIELETKLSQSILSTEVTSVQSHMCLVESWRDRVTKYNMLTTSFVDHCKSTYFLLPDGKNVRAIEKEAHQKKLQAGFVGLKAYTEELIKSVDSRVNLCKVVLRAEIGGATPTTFR
jgi:hypothetical protein